MMRRLALIGVMLLLACVNLKKHIPAKPQIDDELKPYVARFLQYCRVYQRDCSRVSKFSIKLSDFAYTNELLKMRMIGLCLDPSNEIQIDEVYFEKSSPAEREALIMHELGHCILELEHTDDSHLEIMNHESFPSYIYLRHYNTLFNKFFSCISGCPKIEFNEETYKE